MSLLKKYKLFDLDFVSLPKKEIRSSILELKQPASVLFTNAHVVVEASQNPDFKATLQKASLIVPDGAPIAWLLNSLGSPQAERYSGPDLMVDLFEETKDLKHFFLGSTPETLEKIKTRFKGNAVGFYSPPFASEFSHEEKLKQLDMVCRSQADFIWVGLGAPKQEKYVIEMSQIPGSQGTWLAVGAAFDFYSGQKPRAPELLQKIGMEWAFRLAADPKRLASRYLKTNPVFIKLAIQELAKRS